MDALSLHSGEYVEHFKGLSTVRVERLVPKMQIGPNDAILDCGCGTGAMTAFLPPHGDYRGVDFSPDFIEAARQMRPGYEFVCADLVEYCGEHPAAFDIATTFDFSEHIDDKTFREIYSAIRGALRPGGRLYLHTPNAEFIIEMMKDRGIMRQFPEHIAVRSPAENADLLRECGFAGVKVQTIPHYNVLKWLHPLARLPLIGKHFAARIWIEAIA